MLQAQPDNQTGTPCNLFGAAPLGHQQYPPASDRTDLLENLQPLPEVVRVLDDQLDLMLRETLQKPT
jgi:hypothetical protein